MNFQRLETSFLEALPLILCAEADKEEAQAQKSVKRAVELIAAAPCPIQYSHPNKLSRDIVIIAPPNTAALPYGRHEASKSSV